MNKVMIIGGIGKDIELKHTNSGKATCTLSVGVSRPKNKDGVSETDWINCVAWDRTAELCDQYLHKGSKVGVTGRLQTRNYDDKDGKKVYVTEVVVENIEFLSPKSSEAAPTPVNDNPAPVRASETFRGEAPMPQDDDDLPFDC